GRSDFALERDTLAPAGEPGASLRLRKRGRHKVLRRVGSSLRFRRSSCGFENAPKIKFCGECGKPRSQTANPEPVPDPRSYTPKHLAEKILTSRSALEGERKQVRAAAAVERCARARSLGPAQLRPRENGPLGSRQCHANTRETEARAKADPLGA